ncbi:hypothetical protein LJ739_14745 [Aestuariibacter halophilus]|uniref:Uncharacterized protein n=1 Tax=Fluctibacter halophilus TaxID=226011 RepID=A0ABS8GAQ0_9ALTE|nr:hypothetical protein [Aestuariibacter halophilus]MCC2617509.1 hypothetical protein [Aestuariibacter halophilus]
MLRLTQQAWNNLLIVAMLAMILLFNLTGPGWQNEESVDDRPVPLLPPQGVILSIESDGSKVQRIGKGWRKIPSDATPEPQLAAWVQRWTEAQGVVSEKRPPGQPSIVVVWLAGESQGRVFELFHDAPQPIVRYQQRHWVLDNVSIDDLTMPGV